MACFDCGNCKQGEPMYYCTARNEFVIGEQTVLVKERDRSSWKKGDPEYELRRRRVRQDKEDLKKIG